MSVVAWDGKTLAADKLGLYGCVTSATTKLFDSNNGGAVAFVGTLENGLALVDWYMRGANKDEWPDSQKDDNNWSVLIVAEPGVAVHFYERLPFPQQLEDRFCFVSVIPHFGVFPHDTDYTQKRTSKIFTVPVGD